MGKTVQPKPVHAKKGPPTPKAVAPRAKPQSAPLPKVRLKDMTPEQLRPSFMGKADSAENLGFAAKASLQKAMNKNPVTSGELVRQALLSPEAAGRDGLIDAVNRTKREDPNAPVTVTVDWGPRSR